MIRKVLSYDETVGLQRWHIAGLYASQTYMVSIPDPSFLDECDPLGFVGGERRWRGAGGKRLYTWDSLHGEIEIFDKRGRHLGAADPLTGVLFKPAVKGRKIDV